MGRNEKKRLLRNDKKRLLNNEEAAEYIGLKPQTMHNRRFNGLPPGFVKIGRRCLYEVEVLDKFIADNRVEIE